MLLVEVLRARRETKFIEPRAASLYIIMHFFNDSFHSHVTSTFIKDLWRDGREKSRGCCCMVEAWIGGPIGLCLSPLGVALT